MIVLGLLAGYATVLLRHERRNLLALLLALVAGFHAYYVWVGGDWVVLHTSRYLVAVVPLLIVLLCGGAWRVSDWLRQREFSSAAWAGAFGAQLLLMAFSLNPAASVSEWHARSPRECPRHDELKARYRDPSCEHWSAGVQRRAFCRASARLAPEPDLWRFRADHFRQRLDRCNRENLPRLRGQRFEDSLRRTYHFDTPARTNPYPSPEG